MAVTTIKSTYSLDVETVRQLEAMARRWKVSKTEALRRAIRAAARQHPTEAQGKLEALERLQSSLDLNQVERERWEKVVRDERRVSERNREP